MANNLTTALVFVMALNVFMALGQAAVLEINPEASIFYNKTGTVLDSVNHAGTDIINSSDTIDQLPSGETAVNPTGDLITDTFQKLRSWIIDSTGLSYLFDILSAPANIMKALQLPSVLANLLGVLWYGLTFFLLIAFLFGRNV